MQHNGYQTVFVTSYAVFKSQVNLNGWDLDGSYGDQCYDIALLLWYSIGYPAGYPVNGGTHLAKDIWTERETNKSYNGTQYFDLIYNLNDVKQGDVLIYDSTPYNEAGHVGLADEDYSTWHENNPSSYEFPILSQNNQGTPYAGGGTYANIHGYDTRLFLGAFRYKEWNVPPTPPTPSYKLTSFPFVLFAERLRNDDNLLY